MSATGPGSLLAASGWAHVADGSAAPPGLAAAVATLLAEDGGAAAGGALVVLGCGGGAWLAPLAPLGRPLLGVDASRRALAAARERLGALADAGGAGEAATLLHADPREAPPLPPAAVVLLAPPGLDALGTDAERIEVLRTAALAARAGGGKVVIARAGVPADVPPREAARPSGPFAAPGGGPPLRRFTWAEVEGPAAVVLHHRFEATTGGAAPAVAAAGVRFHLLDDARLADLARRAGLAVAPDPTVAAGPVRFLSFRARGGCSGQGTATDAGGRAPAP